MGGISMANLAREVFDGRTANVLRGRVSMANNGGFIQMATNLAPFSSDYSSSRKTVDASRYDGVEIDMQNFNDEVEGQTENFNVQ
jgi:Complex I intermediate-associated protein 30 (CIA30)